MATHSSVCLENLRDEGAWWAAVYGVTQSRTRLPPLKQQQQQHRLLYIKCLCLFYELYWLVCIPSSSLSSKLHLLLEICQNPTVSIQFILQ